MSGVLKARHVAFFIQPSVAPVAKFPASHVRGHIYIYIYVVAQ